MLQDTPSRSPIRWTPSIIVLHWMTVAGVIVLLITGWQLASHAAQMGQRTALLQWHASAGLVLLAATAVRILIRLTVRRPCSPVEGRLRHIGASTVQVALYLAILALVVTGIMAAAPPPFMKPVQVFGMWPLPRISGISSMQMRAMPGVHAILGWLLLGLTVAHIVAAAYGTAVRKDGTILRILPSLGWRRSSVWMRATLGASPTASTGDLPKGLAMGRTVAIAVLLLFLLFAGALLSIPFWAGGGAPQLAVTTPVTFQKDIAGTRVEGRLAITEPHSFDLWIGVEAGNPNAVVPMPTVVFSMPDHSMPSLRPPLVRLDDQRFAAQGLFPMSGRWQLQVILPQGSTEIPFDLVSPVQ